jgi:hypothetical protein
MEVTPLREINHDPQCCGRPMGKTINGQNLRTMRYLFICRQCRAQQQGELVNPPAVKQTT